jgi:hypothetical protein
MHKWDFGPRSICERNHKCGVRAARNPKPFWMNIFGEEHWNMTCAAIFRVEPNASMEPQDEGAGMVLETVFDSTVDASQQASGTRREWRVCADEKKQERH